MKKTYSYLELMYASIPIFANDGIVDADELDSLVEIALRDGQLDNDEKRVLQNIFAQLRQHEVGENVWARVNDLRKKYQF